MLHFIWLFEPLRGFEPRTYSFIYTSFSPVNAYGRGLDCILSIFYNLAPLVSRSGPAKAGPRSWPCIRLLTVIRDTPLNFSNGGQNLPWSCSTNWATTATSLLNFQVDREGFFIPHQIWKWAGRDFSSLRLGAGALHTESSHLLASYSRPSNPSLQLMKITANYSCYFH